MPVFEVTASVQVAFRLTALNWRPMNRTEHTFRTLRALDMKTTLSFATVIFGAIATVVSPLSQARDLDYDEVVDNHDVQYARVVSVEPLRRTVRVHQPVQQCWSEPVTYSEPVGHRHHRGRSYTGPIVGGILGGVVGNQFGKGSGRTLLTVAGAVLGASVGNDVSRRGHSHRHYARTRTYTVNEQRCETTSNYRTEERIDGYLVEYSYNGRIYSTRMDRHPGRRIPVTVSVAPRY